MGFFGLLFFCCFCGGGCFEVLVGCGVFFVCFGVCCGVFLIFFILFYFISFSMSGKDKTPFIKKQ